MDCAAVWLQVAAPRVSQLTLTVDYRRRGRRQQAGTTRKVRDKPRSGPQADKDNRVHAKVQGHRQTGMVGDTPKVRVTSRQE